MIYRAQQFWNAVTASLDQNDLDEIREVLPAKLLNLFLQMQVTEQTHSFQVFRKLKNCGATNPDLLQAALLHDVGKVKHPLHVWERVEIVLVKMVAPEKAKDWGKGFINGWRRPFVIAFQHAGWGAEMAQEAGASPMVVSLINRHHEKVILNQPTDENDEDQLLSQLQTYDNES
ncbi:MAG TPA: HD domain-containing protein [Anaerolineales bacterium]|nr:HD domain-containing protein [Anaerolineales bacterium]